MRLPRLFALGLVLALLLGPVIAYAQQSLGGRQIASSQVSVATSATQTAQARSNRLAVTIQNHTTNNIYCGRDNAVSAVTGFRLPGVDGASITIPTSAVVWCIAVGGASTVSIVESYN